MGVDQMGTMFARREGTDPKRCRSMSAAISTPSRPAASIDGVLGVLGGLEVSAR